MPISRIPGVGLDTGSSGVAPSNLSTGAPSWDGSGNVTCLSSISVGNATPTTSGVGITFPATQSASSNANTLDDYEEGTWTPTLTSSGATFTYGANTGGVYVKIGRFVQLHGVLVLTNRTGGTAGNSLSISNLPFAPGNPDFGGSGTGITITSISGGITVPANSTMWTAAVRSGTSVFPYYSSTNGGGITIFQYGQITATMALQFALSYYTDA